MLNSSHYISLYWVWIYFVKYWRRRGEFPVPSMSVSSHLVIKMFMFTWQISTNISFVFLADDKQAKQVGGAGQVRAGQLIV